MDELIARLRDLVESIEAEDGSNTYTRGCHDVLLAMEGRVSALRTETRPVRMGQNDSGRTLADDLWERA